ncbi:MAG: hypothetical protein CME40_03135 [Haliea sp.]|nr:hypothetical protein [Haliea sp.]
MNSQSPTADELTAAIDQALSVLAPVDLQDLMTARPEPPRYLVEPYLPRRNVTLLGGHGGAGKTALALVLAAHVAAGERFADKLVERDRVVVVSLEDEAPIMRLRLKWIIDEYQLNHFNVLDRLELLDGTDGYAALMTEGEGFNAPAQPTPAYYALRDLVAGAGLIVIDNASDAFDANENARRSVRAFIRALGQIARENDAAVLLLAHIDKAAARNGAQGNSYSGSTAWHNSSRSRLALLVQEDGSLVLEHEKLNVGRRADPLPLVMTAKGIPIPQQVRTLTDGLTAQGDRQELVRVFEAADKAGISIPANLVPGAHCAMNVLANLAEYPARFQANKQGRTLAAKALTSMLRDGVLVEEEYTKPNRHKGTRLVLADRQECADPHPEPEISATTEG